VLNPPAFILGAWLAVGQGNAANVDVVMLPNLGIDLSSTHDKIGGIFTSLAGSRVIDRIALKRKWILKPRPHLPIEAWNNIIRFWEDYAGPWMFVDVTRPNLLRPWLQVGQYWFTAAGVLTVPRADGAIILNVSSAVQNGIQAQPVRGQLAQRIVAGTTYNLNLTTFVSNNQTVLLSLVASIAWYDNTSSAPISVTVLPTFTNATGILTPVQDRTINGRRQTAPGTAPAGATYAQIRFSNAAAGTSSAVDITDVALVPTGGSDHSIKTFLIDMDPPDEIHNAWPYVTIPVLNFYEV
jgi:hypothetical protein